MMFLAPGDPDVADAMAAAQAVAVDSPAYDTLAWHRIRLLIDQGEIDEARTELDRLLASSSLPAGVGKPRGVKSSSKPWSRAAAACSSARLARDSFKTSATRSTHNGEGDFTPVMV